MDLISLFVGVLLGAALPGLLAWRLNRAQVGLRDAKATAELDLATARAEYAHMRSDLNKANGDLLTLESKCQALQDEKTRLEIANTKQETQLKMLGEAKEQMAQEFRVMAAGIVKEHGESMNKQNKEQLDALLVPLRDNLHAFRQNLTTQHTESAKDRASLAEQIRKLSEDSARITREADNLTRALKADSQAQGAWGEMILDTILERSGLREGEEYTTQESYTTEDGRRLRLDVRIRLPGDRQIIVDSKVSLKDFEAFINAETDEARSVHLKAHINSLRNHIRTLSAKEYHKLTEGGLDYVILFVPIEAALAAALKDDRSLIDQAAEANIVIATPTNLMMALKTVANVWHVERRNRNAEDIAGRAGELYDKFSGFVDDMLKIGTQLNAAQDTYGKAMGKLSTGKGNVMRQVQMLKDLGAKTGKSLPQDLLDSETAPPALPPPDSL